MALAKLRIVPLAPSKLGREFGKNGIEVLFNPNAYTITKSVTWSPPQLSSGTGAETQKKLDAPILSFGGGGSRQLSLELFFDVTEPINGRRINDVRQQTNKIVQLTRIERDQDRPPVCEVSWGQASPSGSDFPFTGVVSSLTHRFTLFSSDGRPLRANLTVAFTEFLDPTKNQRQTDQELTTRVVKHGDTLSGIAAEAYRDPARWRFIAEANRLDNPRRLEIGQRLTIPKLG